MGRLHTRYSPVRRSSASASTPVTPRLACVKPAASVHPEPGSNSPSYKLCFSDEGLKKISRLDLKKNPNKCFTLFYAVNLSMFSMNFSILKQLSAY